MSEISEELPFEQLVSEADIDWILCVELNADATYRKWLGARIFGFEPVHVRAWRSVADPLLGESDLIWLVSAPDGTRCIALIENKINAQAQPLQYERYVLRATQYMEQGHCAAYRIALIAPQAYKSSDSSEYEISISYESIKDWYAANETERAHYLSTVFQAALSRPSALPPSPEITAFRRQVWQLARAEFPQLGLEEPRPVREYWVAKNYGEFWIKYKMYSKSGVFSRSVVDLELPGRSAQLDLLRGEYAADLDRIGASLVPAGKSAAIRFEVPCARPPDFDEPATRAALNAWARLLAWWKERSAA